MSSTFTMTQNTWRYYKNVFSSRHKDPEWWEDFRLIVIENAVIKGDKQDGLGKH